MLPDDHPRRVALTPTQVSAVRAAAVAHQVARLELFGSAARGVPEPRDYDFLVSFRPLTPLEQGRAYRKLLAALEDLLQAPVDLLVEGAISNQYFLRAIEQDRLLLYH